ncbi:MAG: ketol-acid reductoisomerase [Candidatus Zixiibacteriota bacterium]|nr:MAG: ketol-acid reductoisomerase [candidate division Zixibacteria bacterium]
MTAHPSITILGYGSQGRAWALNLRDAGWQVTIGLPSRSKSRNCARRDRFKRITTTARAVKGARMIVFAMPDHLHGCVFYREILPNLAPHSTLVFLHGFAVHFKIVNAPPDADVILLAPLGPGSAVREKFLARKSVGFFYTIHQNGSGRAKTRLNTLLKGLHVDRETLIMTSFADEAIGDLFGEQAVLCGGLTQLIKAGYDILRDAGLSSDKAYLEVAYQLDLIVDLIRKYGIEGMYDRISVTARYGSFLAGPEVIDKNVSRNMKQVLAEITSGRFARRLSRLDPDKIKKLQHDLKRLSSPSFEKSARTFSPVRKNGK